MTKEYIGKYLEFVETNNLPLFYQPWYLDAVCQEGEWGASMAVLNDEIWGIWPYYRKQKLGITYLTLPHLTPYLGPYIKNNSGKQKEISRISFHKKILSILSDNLPRSMLHVSQGYPDGPNWQALSWKGFKQTTRYTYRITLSQSLDDIWSSFESKKRNMIKNAQQKIIIKEETNIDELYKLYNDSFLRKGRKVPFNENFFNKVNKVLSYHDSIFSFSAFYDNKRIASVYLVHDISTAYLIITGRNNEGPKGSVSALIWKSIEEAKLKGLNFFDFEGSMIEDIEYFFRSFGGKLTPYHRLYRTPNKLSELLFLALNKI